MAKEQIFYFLHIPKTAGTSINAWLHSQRHYRICTDGLWSSLLQRNYNGLQGYNMFAGHFYTFLDSYLQQDLTIFTFLRNPVERSVSHYLHILRDPAHYLHKRAVKLKTFMGFMRDPVTRPIIENFQTRALSLRFDILNLPLKKPFFRKPRYWLEQHIECCMEGYASKTHLPAAMRYLDNCCAVGITERMEDSIAKLKTVLALKNGVDDPPLFNVTKNKHTFHLKDDERLILNEIVADDIALYEYANTLVPALL